MAFSLCRSLALSAAAALALACAQPEAAARGGADARESRRPDTAFAGTVARLSEPAGSFDTDNLISNESGYLGALDDLRRLKLHGGAYIGVGPDQNFSYIAELEPSVAFVLDIRRDNLLLHLLYRALFESAASRIEYLALLFGRPLPPDPHAWTGRRVEDLLAFIEGAPVDTALVRARRVALDARIAGFAVPLSDADRATIHRLHDTFVAEGPALRFSTFGREPQWYYPTYRQLLAARDRAGRPASYLADERRFRTLRRLQLQGRVVPLVGDFSGPTAVAGIGALLRARGERVTVFYTSNVEFYLWQDGTFGRFASSVAALPWQPEGAIIRSYFPGGQQRHPQARPDEYATQLVQRVRDFTAGQERGWRSYWELVTSGVVGAER
jgi:hypothetical protein